MKRIAICILLFTLLLAFSPMALSVSATKIKLPQQAVWDEACIFTDAEISALDALAQELYGELGCGFVVITTFDFYSTAEMELYGKGVDALYQGNYCAIVIFVPSYSGGSGALDGVLEFETYTDGSMTDRVSMNKLQRIMDHIEQDVKYGSAYDGVAQYFREMAEAHRIGKAPRALLIGGVVGLAAGGIMVIAIVISYKRKSRSASYPLEEYTRLYLTTTHDTFLYRNVVRTVRNNGSGSGGRSGGGGGGGRSGGRR
jgi:uncharacterized membrane protein YgcG